MYCDSTDLLHQAEGVYRIARDGDISYYLGQDGLRRSSRAGQSQEILAPVASPPDRHLRYCAFARLLCPAEPTRAVRTELLGPSDSFLLPPPIRAVVSLLMWKSVAQLPVVIIQ